MTLEQQVFAQAFLMAGDLTQHQIDVLNALCAAACLTLSARLREGLQPEDCKADFIAAASLWALAALNGVDEDAAVEQITAGDLTIRRGGRDAAANCLRAQAELIMSPYLTDRFSFQGV